MTLINLGKVLRYKGLFYCGQNYWRMRERGGGHLFADDGYAVYSRLMGHA
jgi:hypothetical protein